MPSPRPVIAVIGTTGVGKSNYAVALARALAGMSGAPPPLASSGPATAEALQSQLPLAVPRRGVVLSADSMQLYAGLDTITNKITPGEARGVEHWGVGVVRPGEGGAWEIGRWISEAEKRVRWWSELGGQRGETDGTRVKIAEMPPHDVPIVCGGTHYYTQHLLFPPAQLSTTRDEARERSSALRWTPPGPLPALPADFDPGMRRYLETFYLAEPVYPPAVAAHAPAPGPSRTAATPARPTLTDASELLALHQLLAAVDPDEAQRWHWRDGRKVRRAIERWWEAETGARAEPEQAATEPSAGHPRFK